MTTFFTAGTHFGDHRAINIQRRPFTGAGAMDEVLVANWNAVVGAADEVWHLGDFARRAADVPALLARLNGRKHLLRGNNDPEGTLAAAGWASVGRLCRDRGERAAPGPVPLSLPLLERPAPRRPEPPWP